MSIDDLEQVKANLRAGEKSDLSLELHEVQLSPKLKAEAEAEEAQRLASRWAAGKQYLDQVDPDPGDAVLRVCAATQAYLEGKLLDAISDEDTRPRDALIRCEKGDEPFIDITPATDSRLARAYKWNLGGERTAPPLRLLGAHVSSQIATMLGTTDAAGQWIWKEQCRLFNEWNDNHFLCLFSALDINPLGNHTARVGLKNTAAIDA